MALRLRRDVQKASYYVWFLGAEEARGLRGPRVINPVVPYLVERAREQEPLKVTLQVSHKGIKILQGSSKHFIPHSAITSSVQTEDIVACVLLLYNPATKCPLHVHAYRCDSETTAAALHQQLQILINRPENQKRFAELESRLGISAQLAQPPPPANIPEQKRPPRRVESSPKRFESSLGSDTGTSTRESECSEEHSILSPMSPLPKAKVSLFDSLAAELRAKLNGNGPPLLLPPRDYDTVHRSKGNLAATELRRCQNRLIVGATNPNATTKQVVSSRGSSGIGSDLAPSPERQDGHSSSEEENWSNEADNSIIALQPQQARRSIDSRYRSNSEMSDKAKPQSGRDKYSQESKSSSNNYHRSLNREKEVVNRKSWSREDEIRPIIMRPSDFDARFKKVMLEGVVYDKDIEYDGHPRNGREHAPPPQERKYRKHSDDKKPVVNPKYSPENEKFSTKLEKSFQHKLSLEKQRRYDYEENFDSDDELPSRGENLTDKQKYHEAYIKKEKGDTSRHSGSPKYRETDDSRIIKNSRQRSYYRSPERDRHRSVDRQHHPVIEREYYPQYNDRKPHKEFESVPYRENVQKLMKSPVMRYKSCDDSYRGEYVETDMPRPEIRSSYNRSDKYAVRSPERYENERQYPNGRRQNKSSSPDSSIKVSPKDRFFDAKEKFRALERTKFEVESSKKVPVHPGYPELHRRGSLDPVDTVDTRYDNWSDEEQPPASRKDRRDRERNRDRSRDYERDHDRSMMREQYHRNEKMRESMQYPMITNSKSLSNIAKGYRHSYAEPRPALPRASGRVGIAAVNPF